MPKPTLTLCASASFYDKVIEYSYNLEEQGFRVILPSTAAKMRREGLGNDEVITNWSTTPVGYHGKALLIEEHFREIERGDAVLVMNFEKHGKPNYIGPNVLMEMAVAFYLHKPIYVLHDTPKDSPLLDEILGLEPIFLRGDLSNLPSAL